jgi:hypothetical protein
MMALPKIDTPVYEITLPISQVQLKFRPFLVKEQKILLIAMESKDEKEIENNIQMILNNCNLSDVNIDTLPLVDIEYYFLNLRARSVGEVVDSRYKCENEVNGEKCGNLMDVNFDILNVNVTQPPEGSDLIKISDSVGIKMRYPNFEVSKKIKSNDSATDSAFKLVLECIDYVYDNDTLYYANEVSQEELLNFIESMTKEQFEKIEFFIDNLPKLDKVVDIKCKKCGFDHKIELQGLQSFFG